MKPKKPLTPRSIDAIEAAPKGKRVLIWDATIQGFAVRVTDTGSKSFVLVTRYPGDKHPSPRAIGTVGAISLAKAREKATEWLEAIADGIDPKTLAEEAQANTLRAVAKNYLAREGKKLRTVDQREDHFNRLIFPILGDRPIGEIRRSEIISLMDKIEDNHGIVLADRVLATLQRTMNWHASRDEEFRSPIVRGMMRTKPKERARKRVLNDDELRLFWEVAEQRTCPYDYMLQFILLTATRLSDANHMQVEEVSEADWVIPAERYKTKFDHLVPVSTKAKTILALLPKTGWVFTNNGKVPIGNFSKSKNAFDARVAEANDGEPLPHWTTHDLRRTARTLMSRAGVNGDIAERCLGHVMIGVRGTYDRYEYRDEKAQAFEALAALIDRIVHPQANIVPLRAAQ